MVVLSYDNAMRASGKSGIPLQWVFACGSRPSVADVAVNVDLP
jgi:hypothetical protein